VAVALVVEAAMSAMWIAQIIPRLDTYGPLIGAFVLIRAVTAALQGTAGVMAFAGHPAAVLFGQRALLLSAVLLTFELGAGVTPTSVFPTWRWPLVAAYWAYALAAVWILEVTGKRR